MADRILFLENGRLEEQGTHEHLTASGSHYEEPLDWQAVRYL